jgi:hypothetical protein
MARMRSLISLNWLDAYFSTWIDVVPTLDGYLCTYRGVLTYIVQP